jgi:glycosyltransferase involved in cell wall biosynthesis
MHHKESTMNIFVVEQRGFGGMIHYAYQMCTAMANEGAKVTLITAQDYELENFPHNFEVLKLLKLWSHTDSLASRIPRNALESWMIKAFRGIRRIFRGFRWFVEWTRLTSYLSRAKPDIVQYGSIEFPFEAFFLWWLRLRGLHLGQICHEYIKRGEHHELLSSIILQINYQVYKNFSAIFLHSENIRDDFLHTYEIPLERLHLIVHGNEMIFPKSTNQNSPTDVLRQQYQLGMDQRIILFFGSITPDKGVADLVKAFARVHAAQEQTRLVIAGMPSKEMDMKPVAQLVDELSINHAVTFDLRYLPINEIESLMKLADVVVFPYTYSTQSGAIHVAYAFGKPVVATSVGEFPEVVEDGKSGYLVPPEAPEVLADAILKIINDPAQAETMGAYAKHLSETKFSWKPIAQKILKAYANTLQDSNREFKL